MKSSVRPHFHFAKLALLFGTLFPCVGLAAHWELEFSPGQNKVEFFGDGKVMKVHGESDQAKGKFEVKDGVVSGKVTLPLDTLKTKNDTRDGHMRDKYLETSKFPEALFEIKEMKVADPMPAGDFEAPFKAQLTLHGVPQDVEGTAKLNRTGDTLKVNLDFMTKISGYKMDMPVYTSIALKDDVKVAAQFTAAIKAGAPSATKPTAPAAPAKKKK